VKNASQFFQLALFDWIGSLVTLLCSNYVLCGGI